MTWRDKFRPIIAEVIVANEAEQTRSLKDALYARWCELFGAGHTKGSGASWQYKVWRDEIALQLHKRTPADRPRRRIAKRTLRVLSAAEAREWLRKRQMKLFEEGV
jgi:hypothetical protein